jgi:2,3-bisphosphoglycerate-dependent phosphoglycerate mutase
MAHRQTSRLLLVRHCAAQHQGPEAALTAAGQQAAEQLAAQLAGFGAQAVYSSPYARAVATVRPFCERSGLAVTHDDRLRERHLSSEPLSDWLDHLRRSYDDLDYRASGGESLRDVQARGLEVLSEIASRHERAIVATHGQWISAVLHHVDRSFAFDSWRALQNPDLFVVWWKTGFPLGYERMVHQPTLRA